MMIANPRGWKKRRAEARRRRNDADPEERQRIRAIRRAFYNGARTPEAPAKAAEAPVAEGGNDGPATMTREAMMAELRAAGKFVPPRIGDAKLRERVKELRDEEATKAD